MGTDRVNRKCDEQLLAIGLDVDSDLDCARRDVFSLTRIVSSWWTGSFGRSDLDIISSADQRPPAVEPSLFPGDANDLENIALLALFKLAPMAHTIFDTLHVVKLQPDHRIQVVYRLASDLDKW